MMDRYANLPRWFRAIINLLLWIVGVVGGFILLAFYGKYILPLAILAVAYMAVYAGTERRRRR